MAAIRAEQLSVPIDWARVPAHTEQQNGLVLKEELTLAEGLREVYGPGEATLLLKVLGAHTVGS